jgi:uncharacterized membrane protein
MCLTGHANRGLESMGTASAHPNWKVRLQSHLSSGVAWLKARFEIEHWMRAAIALCFLILLILVLTTDRGIVGGNHSPDTILSAILQAAAAILALVVSFTLVATQLAAGHYTPKVVELRLRDPWFWGAVGVYLMCMGWALLGLCFQGPAVPFWEDDGVNVAALLACLAFLYLPPFAVSTLKSLRANTIAESLVGIRAYEALDEMLRGAIDKGNVTVVAPALESYRRAAIAELERRKGDQAVAEHLSRLFLLVGRHACHRKSPDTFLLILENVTGLVTYCDDYTRRWRRAAEVFNGVATGLYRYSREFLEARE